MKTIRKMRREHFGGIIFSENPGFTAFINNKYADKLGIPKYEHPLNSNILSSPMDVHMSLTNKCNLLCKGCYAINTHSQESEMDYSLAKSIIDNLSNLNVFTISLGGGEPFLYPNLFNLARYIRENNIVPNITTNGLEITKINSNQCNVFGNIHLSIHSIDELTRLEKTIKILQQESIIPGINLLITNEIYHNIEYVFRWASKLNLVKILFLKFKITNNNAEYKNMEITSLKEKNLYPIIVRLSQKYNIMPMIDCSLFPSISKHKVRKKDLEYYDINGCKGGIYYIAIDVHGNFKPCSFWNETFGIATSLNYDEWLNNSALNEFRSGKQNLKCSPCKHIELCNKGCRLFATQTCQTL
ncbi:radical SAM/SPASM domain-containing protein [Pseudobacteroides cellulosolvens]|uniref:4Fe4S-binding SPASM domain containing protein n=1 Tax=Pseudobacteroides cellulosolvens ATCC 35603 = DSM 2933 TaxID=398512 RepID=A0A0L6JXR0_9FIRM|nr:radical SAM/SPASM domain-containing protein [Pseudobacteroides cellulosolvens]KNY30212.1 4Fe4S-binding SPASM domain containing protein [Pseudobacteroides cellulosolvens ATCC 35603 = DSM 2933]